MQPLPVVAIVGRPNVGKSTLFNRLVGRRQAIVHDQPGVTRDRLASRLEIDPGHSIELIDTGGLVPGDDPLGLSEQVMLAVEESEVLLFVVDGVDGPTAADEKVWSTLRRTGKPTIAVVNKGDTNAAREQQHEFYRLGVDRLVLVSAEHGLGIGDLFDLLRELLPAEAETSPAGASSEAAFEGGVVEDGEFEDGDLADGDLADGDTATNAEPLDDGIPSLAVVGRPNVGKSSLINKLLGMPRVLVSPVAGTTRDPIDSLLDVDGVTYRLIDTAGIRRRSQVSGVAEEIAVLFARRQIERAQVVVLVVDAAAGVTTGDRTIAGLAWDLGRPVVVAVNKWDLLDDDARTELEESWLRLDQLLASPSRVNLSALTGRRVDRLLPAVASALERSRLQLSTSEVNRLFERAVAMHQPPQVGGRPWRVYYATQVKTAPPTFMLFANRTLERTDTYRRYLENRLRDELDLSGVPIRLVIRRRA
ncbi:MAG: ribosome biogenesis GTPase Der [Acidobacteriota bacterium]